VEALSRRKFLGLTGGGAFAMAVVGARQMIVTADPTTLQPPDANGLKLQPGFTSRIIATTGQAVGATGYVWHKAPDGGACFALPDGGWSYVSNSESAPGGVSYVRFSSTGAIVGAGRCLTASIGNCAGGATPWGTWLSCEEFDKGRVIECHPTGATPAQPRLAMGRFTHEAAAVDAVNKCVYLTEDKTDGALYRFRPTTWGDLSAGKLDVLTKPVGKPLTWVTVPDPDGDPTPTRNQVANTRRFKGGEGAAMSNGRLIFTTKGDNRVWRYDPKLNQLAAIYDPTVQVNGVLSGVDNVATRQNVIYVAEDGGNMQVVLVRETGKTFAVVEVSGVTGSEITGPAFNPAGNRLYFSSQRNPGTTYEVTGPWGNFT
jgi:hypothetical protein